MNFLHGIPHFAISVALEKEKEIICGAIYDPIKDELFFAEKNQGAFLNNKKIRVSKRKSIKDCMLFTGGTSAKYDNKEMCLEEYNKISNFLKSPLRKMGSAALDMAYVAAGRTDGFFQRNLSYWDIAAGIIIIKEAGGIISDFSGNKEFVEKKNIIATNSYINRDLINILKT